MHLESNFFEMTFDEYKQLRAYSWYDSIYLSVVWAASFACFIGSMTMPLLGMLNTLLMLATPFFVGYRLKIYRKEGRNDQISFKMALLYCFRVFFNASIIFSILQWAYMQFLDPNLFSRFWATVIEMPEMKAVLKQAGISMKEMTQAMVEITPLQFASSMLIQNLIIGFILSFFIAAVMKKGKTPPPPPRIQG